MLNLNEMMIFLVAAETGNYSEAGRRLHLSQPAISQTMDNLEKRFGIELFKRVGRTVQLTEAGQVLKPMARELVTAANRLDETMISLKGEVIGEIQLGCSTAAGKYLLPVIIARYRRLFPQVRVNIFVSNRDWVIQKLLLGEFTLGVSSKMVEHRDLEYQDFFTDEVLLIVPKGHRWARYSRVFPDDLLDEDLILREDGAGTREVLLAELQGRDISVDMLKIGMVLGNTEAIILAVEEGIGVAFVSRLAAERSLECGRVVAVNVEGMPLKRNIYLIRNRRFPATRAQSELWSFFSSDMTGLEEKCRNSALP